MERSRGRYCLLLNEDSELLPGATRALYDALEADSGAACAVGALKRPDGAVQPSAWRFPGVGTALLQALFLHRMFVVQSKGSRVRRIDWGQSAALLVRRAAAEQIGWMDETFFVYSDEVDFEKRLADAGWHNLYVPDAVAIHHEQLSTDAVPERRIVELARGRDRYMRKHHGAAAALAVRALIAWSYLVRMLVALARAARPGGAIAATSQPRCGPRAGRGCAKARRRAMRATASAGVRAGSRSRARRRAQAPPG